MASAIEFESSQKFTFSSCIYCPNIFLFRYPSPKPVSILEGSYSITFTLYIVQCKWKIVFLSLLLSLLTAPVFHSIKRCILFLCFSTINIVNAFIYSAFRRQKQTEKGNKENYVSWFKVNKSSCLRT